MRFIGNKEKLVDWIYDELKFTDLSGGLFFDFFRTTNVAKHFKKMDSKLCLLIYFTPASRHKSLHWK